MTSQNGRAFNEWLRAQLKAKKMSQRQLAQQSGVDHSTISRLIRGDRMPSLGTATKLARGLRELREDADTPAYLGLVSSTTQNPTARVEYALRADDLLSEAQVRQIMEYYLAVRMRRYGRAYQGEPVDRRPGNVGASGGAPNAASGNGLATHGSLGTRQPPMVVGAGAQGSVAPRFGSPRSTRPPGRS
jgi:transcriptional regulator with XRE-family HTH domain